MSKLKKRPYNFGAGPAMLPEAILQEVQAELLDWQHTGMSILEVGHRTDAFMDLLSQAENELRTLLSIPPDYHVLFLGGPARMQFSAIPLNFIPGSQKGAYLDSGLWSSLALKEAQKLKLAYSVASGKDLQYRTIPLEETWRWEKETAYFYFVSNETVQGIRCPLPAIKGLPLIADMTSSLLTEPLPIEKYALIFAGAQKNIANAGLTLAIIRDDFLAQIQGEKMPTLLDYRTHVTHKSLYATPPTFNCYLALKMFQWVKAQGGVEALYKINQEKAARLYDYIDSSDFYICPVDPNFRSIVNVCFTLKQPHLESLFLETAAANGLLSLKGHKTVGGLRASLYNAMPLSGVQALVEFMQDFAAKTTQI